MNRIGVLAWLKLTPLLLCLGVVPAIAVMAAGVVVVSQRNRTFSESAVHIHRGAAIHFINNDVFDHQVFVDTPSFKFSSPEQEPGATTDIPFPTAGTFDVQCEIHPRMHLMVTVD